MLYYIGQYLQSKIKKEENAYNATHLKYTRKKQKKKKNQPTDLTDYGQPVVEKILAYGFFLKTSLYKNKTM